MYACVRVQYAQCMHVCIASVHLIYTDGHSVTRTHSYIMS